MQYLIQSLNLTVFLAPVTSCNIHSLYTLKLFPCLSFEFSAYPFQRMSFCANVVRQGEEQYNGHSSIWLFLLSSWPCDTSIPNGSETDQPPTPNPLLFPSTLIFRSIHKFTFGKCSTFSQKPVFWVTYNPFFSSIWVMDHLLNSPSLKLSYLDVGLATFHWCLWDQSQQCYVDTL